MFKFLRKTSEQSKEFEESEVIKKRVNFQTEIVEVVSESHEEKRKKAKIRRMSSSITTSKVPKSKRFWFPTKVFAALKLSRKHRSKSSRKNSAKIKKRKNSHRTSQKKKKHSNKSES